MKIESLNDIEQVKSPSCSDSIMPSADGSKPENRALEPDENDAPDLFDSDASSVGVRRLATGI